jgi:hypothetical protein
MVILKMASGAEYRANDNDWAQLHRLLAENAPGLFVLSATQKGEAGKASVQIRLQHVEAAWSVAGP